MINSKYFNTNEIWHFVSHDHDGHMGSYVPVFLLFKENIAETQRHFTYVMWHNLISAKF